MFARNPGKPRGSTLAGSGGILVPAHGTLKSCEEFNSKQTDGKGTSMEEKDLLQVTDGEFEQEILKSEIPALVDFWAPWCGPCRMVSPILEQIAKENPGKIKIVKINSDENQHISAQYSIQGIPTIILFRDGKEIDRLIGVAPKENILRFLHL